MGNIWWSQTEKKKLTHHSMWGNDSSRHEARQETVQSLTAKLKQMKN
jgi:hypothetical protein